VGVEVALGAEGNGGHHDQAVHVFSEGRETEPGEVVWGNADEFSFQLSAISLQPSERINKEHILEFGGFFGNGDAGMEVLGEESIDLFEAVVAFGDGHELLFYPITEVDPGNDLYAKLLTDTHTIQASRGVVDVSDTHTRIAPFLRLPQQVVGFPRAVFQAEVGMGVEEHGQVLSYQ